MDVQVREGTEFDPAMMTVTLTGGAQLRLFVFEGHDSTTVLQIDTSGPSGRLRVKVNEFPVWSGHP